MEADTLQMLSWIIARCRLRHAEEVFFLWLRLNVNQTCRDLRNLRLAGVDQRAHTRTKEVCETFAMNTFTHTFTEQVINEAQWWEG